MVVTDAFRFRKNKVRTPIQYAWCAANTKNFVGPSATKISKKEIDDLDISSLWYFFILALFSIDPFNAYQI